METMILVEGLQKSFILHNQGGIRLPVLERVSLRVRTGECVVLVGPSGTGKSTLLRSLYANYKPEAGRVWVRHRTGWVDMASAEARQILEVRRSTLGYVSQFLRVIPRIPALAILMDAARLRGASEQEAADRSRLLLERLGIPERLWSLSPTTFSGGEQQRINIAKGFVHPYPILLLDEPTAALDGANRRIVVELIAEAKGRGAAIVGTFHDEEVRAAVATRALTFTSSEVTA